MPVEFICVAEADEKYAQLMHPYKKWWEKTYVSPFLEMNGSLYRVVSTRSRMRRNYLRKVIICTEQGEPVEDPRIVDPCFGMIAFLHYYKVILSELELDARQYGDDKFGEPLEKLTTIYQDIADVVTAEEKVIIEDCVDFFKSILEILNELAIVSQECLEIVGKLRITRAEDVLTSNFFEHAHELLKKREILRNQFEAEVVKRGDIETVNTKKQKGNLFKMDGILSNHEYMKHMSNKDDRFKVNKKISHLTHICYQVVRVGKKNMKYYNKWLNEDSREYTTEQHIAELLDEERANIVWRAYTEVIRREHWVKAPNLKY